MEDIRALLLELRRKEWVFGALQLATGVVLPVALAVFVNLYTSGVAAEHAAGWVGMVTIVIVQLALVGVSLAGPHTPARAAVALTETHDDLAALQARYKELEAQRSSYYAATKGTNESLTVLNKILRAGVQRVDDETVKQHLGDILRPYIDSKDYVFNFGELGGRYSLTVFVYDSTKDLLVQRYRHVDAGIKQSGRSWKPPDGHVGFCFAREKVMVTPDLTKATEFLGEYTEQDQKQYRSMASVPLFDRGKRCGALVVTCDKPDQFTYENSVEIFEQIGQVLSLYFTYTDEGEPHNATAA